MCCDRRGCRVSRLPRRSSVSARLALSRHLILRQSQQGLLLHWLRPRLLLALLLLVVRLVSAEKLRVVLRRGCLSY